MKSAGDSPRTAREALARGREYLERKGVPEARRDAELLVAHALGLDRLGLYLQLDRPVTAREVDGARMLLVRRGAREPVAYITGRREFYGREFDVDKSVLVPRPETELLVDAARERAKASADGRAMGIADVGTGSGCLAVTLALEIEPSDVVALDVSAEALEVAKRNAERLGARVRFLRGDGPEALAAARPAQGFDLVVSNPPYVRREERGQLAPEIRDWEPEQALFLPEGDPDHWLARLLDAAPGLLAPDGALLIELAAGQAPRALELVRARGLAARCRPDLAGIERVLEVG